GRLVLSASVIGNLGILCFFKYTDFLLTTINSLSGSGFVLLGLTLPIGISFYTFQTMSYTIDVYRGNVKAQHNLVSFGMYVCMFPQLIAGPIVRYSEIAAEVDIRQPSFSLCAAGMQRFLIGLGKKVLLANQAGALWDEIYGLGTPDLSMALAWLGALAFTFQIYFDFSGYSDMAIGLGEMFGFHFPENFRYPYTSKNITEFWRRWHMTLSGWFREYLYIPLGGNRKGIARQTINLFAVWFLTGLWHGAGWNFIFWGLYFFVLLLVEKLFLLKWLKHLPTFLQHAYALFWIILGWVVFACEDLTKLKTYLGMLFCAGVAPINRLALYEWTTHAAFLLILSFASTQLPAKLCHALLEKISDRIGDAAAFWLKSCWCLLVLLLSMAMLVSGSYNPFLYFRF
ncbi:MAG: MBOAT family protein, partial [Eubacterium sp.]|nr:MBOAT family protein [Eubacterium sp.]